MSAFLEAMGHKFMCRRPPEEAAFFFLSLFPGPVPPLLCKNLVISPSNELKHGGKYYVSLMVVLAYPLHEEQRDYIFC